MLDKLIDRLIGRFLTQTACTAHDHREALQGHPLLVRVFFPDLRDEAPVAQDDHLAVGDYGVTV